MTTKKDDLPPTKRGKPMPDPKPLESNDTDDGTDDEDADDWVDQLDDDRPKRLVLPDNADPVVTYRDIVNRPGPTRTQAQITLHTHLAHRMFYGRRKIKDKPGIIGLMRFVNNTNHICNVSKSGDPYADYRLIQIEEAMVGVEQLLQDFLLDVRNLLGSDNDRRVTVMAMGSIKPATFALSFEYPYSFRAADLLGLFDELVSCALAAKHIGRLFDDDWRRVVKPANRKLRALFLLSDGFRLSGTHWDDYLPVNGRAQLVIERYGELPADVLDRRRRPRWAPAPRPPKAHR